MSEFICGRNSVIAALKSEREINRVLIAQGVDRSFSAQVVALCKKRGIPYVITNRLQLEKIAGADNRGIVAQVAAIKYVEIEDILALAAERKEHPLVIVLSEVEDPHNLGAIIRTACCAGAHGIIIPKRRAASVNHTVDKVSAGAVAYMPVARVANLTQAVRELKKAGLWVVAADMMGGDYRDVDLSGPLAIVMGGEDKAIGPLLLKECDFVARIPITGEISSLNVSAAAAILIFEAINRRRGSK
ncbi:MAG: 23S rRNA (guanosine(2251)-2'-O)-methyltransferase RlmB [Bacillota bacterium]|jgi:23S rRNA (guanosine2251-2'-O)-methyltransferase